MTTGAPAKRRSGLSEFAKSREWANARRDPQLPLKPELVAQFEFVEWTDVNHLRHTKFIALREDKNAKDVHRE